MKVTLKTRIVEVAGRRIRFELEAFDEVEKIAEGWHERARVSVPRFASYLESKTPPKAMRRTCLEHRCFALYQPPRRTVRSRALPPTASAIAIRLGFCDSPSRGEC